MAEYTLRLRRYSPETGEAPYWEDFEIDLDGKRSVLDGILQAKDRTDASIGIRCSCRAAICGSCGVRINGKPDLACHTHLDKAFETASDGVIVVEPMGNMPVIKDLIVDMDAVHWKKIQRVTPWLLPSGPEPEREHIVPPESMIDVTQTMACIQCGACVSDCLSMEVDPEFIGPAALAKAYRFVGDPRDGQHYQPAQGPRRGPARDLRLHALLQLHRGVPEGRRPDEPDHAAAPDRGRRARDQRLEQRAPPRGGLRQPDPLERPAPRGRAAAALLRRRLVVRQVPPARGPGAGELAAGDPQGAAARQGDAEGGARAAQAAQGRTSTAIKRIYEQVDDREERFELNLYVVGEEEEKEAAGEAGTSDAAGAHLPAERSPNT